MTSLALTSIVVEPDLASLAEAELVRRAQREPAAFAALYRRHYASIARYIGRRVGDRHRSQDLVGETFLAALAELEHYQERGLAFRAWLYALANSRIARCLRRARLLGFEPLSSEHPSQLAGGASEEREFVRRALLRLPRIYQEALALHYVEELSVTEVAAITGSPEGTVKARLARGRALLRQELVARGFGGGA